MYDIKITKLNATYIKVICMEEHMEQEIADKFSFTTPNAQYDPRVKSGKWDGIKRLYHRRYKRMYTGLLLELVKFLKKQGYTVFIDPDLIPSSAISNEEIEDIIKEVINPHDEGKPLVPYDYQYDSIHYMLNMGRAIPLMATSAGKSLSIYIVVRILQLMDELEDKKIFVVVPTKALVEQMYSDFGNYANNPDANWNVASHCQRINGDYEKYINKHIVITTWQSLKELPPHVMKEAGAIIVDEVHTATASVLTKLLENAVDCDIRFGLTGTLDDWESNKLAVTGLLGPVKRIITAKELIDQGRATDIQVNMMVMDYPVEAKIEINEFVKEKLATVYNKNAIPGARYNAELEYIYNYEPRQKFILNLVSSLKGNSLVLFDRNEMLGEVLYDAHKQVHENTFLIVGKIASKERERIRLILEQYDDAVIFANYSIMSTGTSIKKLHNLILASSTKSKIRVLQSIGRMMRLHKSKSIATVYDIVDKLDLNGKKNTFMKHAEQRIKYYISESFKVKFFPLKLF